MAWTAVKISADAANNIQVEAGLLLNAFDVTNPTEPADADIISATTGDFTITATPQTQDFFEDVNNAPTNSKEGLRITGWDCGLSVGVLEIKDATLKLALGAYETREDGGIAPRSQYAMSDFQKLYWIGDMVDEDALLCVAMDDTVNTNGISLTTSKNGKGNLSLELKPYASFSNPTVVPMAFYILQKASGGSSAHTYTAVSPVGTENPSEEGWYVLSGDAYVRSYDTAVDANKTYFERS